MFYLYVIHTVTLSVTSIFTIRIIVIYFMKNDKANIFLDLFLSKKFSLFASIGYGALGSLPTLFIEETISAVSFVALAIVFLILFASWYLNISFWRQKINRDD